MTAPNSDLPWNVFGDRELTRQATWWARIFAFTNQLKAAADPLATHWKGRAGTTTSVPSAVWTRVPLDTIVYDWDGLGLSTGTYPGGFPVPVTGVYLFGAAVSFSLTGAQLEGVAVARNGDRTLMDGATRLSKRVSNSADGLATPMTVHKLTAGDVLNVYAYQDSGAANPTQGGAGLRTSLTVVRLS